MGALQLLRCDGILIKIIGARLQRSQGRKKDGAIALLDARLLVAALGSKNRTFMTSLELDPAHFN